MSRNKLESSNQGIEMNIPLTSISPTEFSETVKDAVGLAEINEINDPEERKKARGAYYPAPVPPGKKWMAAGGLVVAAFFGFEVVNYFIQGPSSRPTSLRS